MKYLLSLSLLMVFSLIKAQTSHFDDFHQITNWNAGAGYVLSNPGNEELQVVATAVGANYQTFNYTFPTLDLSDHPFVQVKMRSSTSVAVRIDFQDATGRVTNASPVQVTLPARNTYSTYTFDMTGKFSQTYPSAATVNPSAINTIIVYFAPGGNPNYSGTVFFDSLSIGSSVTIPPPPKDIRLNQIGFYPNQPKMAIAVQTEKSSFFIVSSNKQDTLYEGSLGAAVRWNHSGEMAKKADFTSFNTTGTFYLTADSIFSPPFTIGSKVHLNVAKGLIKSYYFNRASMAITAPWGDKWLRPLAHPDNNVLVHSSAATSTTPANTSFYSGRGWYDAGDYNKYMVNSGISTYTMLALYEHFPACFDTLNTFIPESGNNLPDLLDEALWNVRWMLTAQDPSDGSVYHKITNANFSGTVMPHAYTAARYGVQRSTSAALNFAAVMAQAARIFRNFNTELPDFADSCLNASIKAYNWALANPAVLVTANATGISTGVYGDNTVSDELAWARMELYATTRKDTYYNRASVVSGSFGIPGWQTVNTLGLITLVHYRKQLNTAGYADTTSMKNKLLGLANTHRTHSSSSAYGVVMGESSWNFNWGSNAVAGNQGLLLLQAFKLTGDSTYLRSAMTNLDYLLGRNGTGFSFVTGFGTKYPMNPHHRISAADGVAEPVPGMVVGGPNPSQQDNCSGYPSSQAARSYVDTWCSYASNEPAINYTAPVAYLAAGIEAIFAGATYTPPYTAPPVTGIFNSTSATIPVNVYPNPSKEEITVEFENNGLATVSVSDVTGKIVREEVAPQGTWVSQKINIQNLPQGIYFINIRTEEGSSVKKIIRQ